MVWYWDFYSDPGLSCHREYDPARVFYKVYQDKEMLGQELPGK